MSSTPEQPEGSESNIRISDIIKEEEELTGVSPGTEVSTPAQEVMEIAKLPIIIRVHLFLFCKDERLTHVHLALYGRRSGLHRVKEGFIFCMHTPRIGKDMLR